MIQAPWNAAWSAEERILSAIVGGPAAEGDFGVRIGNRTVIGHLKIAWPASRVRRI